VETTSQTSWERILPGESVTATFLVTAPEGLGPGSRHLLEAMAAYRYPDGRILERSATGEVRVRPGPSPEGSPYLSDLAPFDSFNWVGPVEKDQSNGGGAPGDGGPITIEGEVYEKGLGGHAHSEQAYYIGGDCSRYQAVVGVDDAVGDAGSVVFQVWADDEKIFDSGRLTGTDPGVPLSVDVTGVEELKLVAADAGDFVDRDYADWADARVTCNVG
jgi:hypothetical protein